MSRYDYHDQGMYVVSVDVEGREPLLGQTVGTEDEARVDLSAAGIVAKRTAAELKILFPQVSVFMCVVMPEHVHLVLQVQSRLPQGQHVGYIAEVYKARCADRMSSAHLFAGGCEVRVVEGEGESLRMQRYLDSNPRRRIIMQNRKEYFDMHRGLDIFGHKVDAVGNLDLLKVPLIPVHCHRSWHEDEANSYAYRCLRAAKAGCVLIGAFISDLELTIGLEASDREYSIVHIMHNGFRDRYKPLGNAFYACAEGRLLHIAPWEYKPEGYRLTRERCHELNLLAEDIAWHANNDSQTA